jgi:hypothetical protein
VIELSLVMAVQAEYAPEPELIPQASSLLTFLQLLGGVIGIAYVYITTRYGFNN